MNGVSMHYDAVREAFAAACKAAGLKDITSRDLRAKSSSSYT